MCQRESQAREALRRVGLVMQRLGLQLHPEKTRMVDLRRGKEELGLSWVYGTQEAKYPAESTVALHAEVAVAEGDEANSGTRARDD